VAALGVALEVIATAFTPRASWRGASRRRGGGDVVPGADARQKLRVVGGGGDQDGVPEPTCMNMSWAPSFRRAKHEHRAGRPGLIDPWSRSRPWPGTGAPRRTPSGRPARPAPGAAAPARRRLSARRQRLGAIGQQHDRGVVGVSVHAGAGQFDPSAAAVDSSR
jgi:hypothetical protein